MTLLATLIAIAAWCGQPVVRTNSPGPTQPIYTTTDDVDECRRELWDCLQKTPYNPQCFLGEKVKSK